MWVCTVTRTTCASSFLFCVSWRFLWFTSVIRYPSLHTRLVRTVEPPQLSTTQVRVFLCLACACECFCFQISVRVFAYLDVFSVLFFFYFNKRRASRTFCVLECNGVLRHSRVCATRTAGLRETEPKKKEKRGQNKGDELTEQTTHARARVLQNAHVAPLLGGARGCEFASQPPPPPHPGWWNLIHHSSPFRTSFFVQCNSGRQSNNNNKRITIVSCVECRRQWASCGKGPALSTPPAARNAALNEGG